MPTSGYELPGNPSSSNVTQLVSSVRTASYASLSPPPRTNSKNLARLAIHNSSSHAHDMSDLVGNSDYSLGTLGSLKKAGSSVAASPQSGEPKRPSTPLDNKQSDSKPSSQPTSGTRTRGDKKEGSIKSSFTSFFKSLLHPSRSSETGSPESSNGSAPNSNASSRESSFNSPKRGKSSNLVSPMSPGTPNHTNFDPDSLPPLSPGSRGPSRANSLANALRDKSFSSTPTRSGNSFRELQAASQVTNVHGTQMIRVSPNLPPKMARPDWSLKDYAIVEKMYKGYASSVYKAFCKRSGELVCLKVYDLSNLCALNRFQVFREIQLHGTLSHENVINLYGAFQQDHQVVMVQEFADGGDLFTLLHKYGGRLPERQCVDMVLTPFMRVLAHLHQQYIMHRDLKPENILFTRTLGLKLCDFGLAIDLREERAVTRAGTLEYMAPEVLNCPFKTKPEENKENGKLQYDMTVDAWAVGVLTYELLVGFPPFNDRDRAAIEQKIRTDTPKFPSHMSELARNFVLTAMQKDASERPTIKDLMQHPWIEGHTKKTTSRQTSNTTAATVNAKPRHMASVLNSPFEDEEAEDLVVSRNNTAMSFTAGKAIKLSNQAMKRPSVRDLGLIPAVREQDHEGSNLTGSFALPSVPSHLVPSSKLGNKHGSKDKPDKSAIAGMVNRTGSMPYMFYNGSVPGR